MSINWLDIVKTPSFCQNLPLNFKIFPKNSTHLSKTQEFWENSSKKPQFPVFPKPVNVRKVAKKRGWFNHVISKKKVGIKMIKNQFALVKTIFHPLIITSIQINPFFNIFTVFSQYQYQYWYQYLIFFNIKININILEFKISRSRSISIFRKI